MHVVFLSLFLFLSSQHLFCQDLFDQKLIGVKCMKAYASKNEYKNFQFNKEGQNTFIFEYKDGAIHSTLNFYDTSSRIVKAIIYNTPESVVLKSYSYQDKTMSIVKLESKRSLNFQQPIDEAEVIDTLKKIMFEFSSSAENGILEYSSTSNEFGKPKKESFIDERGNIFLSINHYYDKLGNDSIIETKSENFTRRREFTYRDTILLSERRFMNNDLEELREYSYNQFNELKQLKSIRGGEEYYRLEYEYKEHKVSCSSEFINQKLESKKVYLYYSNGLLKESHVIVGKKRNTLRYIYEYW